MRNEKWPATGRLVEVEWIDSASTHGWRAGDASDEDDGLSVCRSAGYLMVRDRRVVKIVQSQALHGQTAEQIAIPRSCVRRITPLSRKA